MKQIYVTSMTIVSSTHTFHLFFPAKWGISFSFQPRCFSRMSTYTFNVFAYMISEKERQQCSITDSCWCMWLYLSDLRTTEGSSHPHYNLFYDPVKFDGALLPPAAALAPTLWPQFHLRWACPSEAKSGELELQCRNMAKKFINIQTVRITPFFFSLGSAVLGM